MPFLLVLLIYNTCLLLYYPNIPILPSCHINISLLHFLIRCLQFLCRPPLHILQKIKTKLISYTIRYIPHKACCLIVSLSSLISCSDPLITRIALISQYNRACTAAISNTVFAVIIRHAFFNFRSACSTHFAKSRIKFPYITYYYFRVSTTRE